MDFLRISGCCGVEDTGEKVLTKRSTGSYLVGERSEGFLEDLRPRLRFNRSIGQKDHSEVPSLCEGEGEEVVREEEEGSVSGF